MNRTSRSSKAELAPVVENSSGTARPRGTATQSNYGKGQVLEKVGALIAASKRTGIRPARLTILQDSPAPRHRKALGLNEDAGQYVGRHQEGTIRL